VGSSYLSFYVFYHRDFTEPLLLVNERFAMDNDLLNFPDDAPFDPSVVEEVKTGVAQMGKDLILAKIQEDKLLRQAQEEVGIGSRCEAIYNLMNYLNIGIRTLSAKVKVPRKKLVRMIEGIVPMTPEVNTAMTAYFTEMSKRQKKNLSFDFGDKT